MYTVKNFCLKILKGFGKVFIYKKSLIYLTKKLQNLILNNIVACGYMISKFDKSISCYCQYCGCIETTEHMLYSCERIMKMWEKISIVLSFNVSWKHLVCGFILRENSNKIRFYNFVLSIIMYAIFKQNSKCKINNLRYENVNIHKAVRSELVYRKVVLKNTKHKLFSNNIYDNIVKIL